MWWYSTAANDALSTDVTAAMAVDELESLNATFTKDVAALAEANALMMTLRDGDPRSAQLAATVASLRGRLSRRQEMCRVVEIIEMRLQASLAYSSSASRSLHHHR